MNTSTRGSVLTAVILWGVLAVIVVGIVVMVLLPKRVEPAAEQEELTLPVVTQVVQPRKVSDSVVLPGTVEAAVDVMVGPEKGGSVAAILVDKGARVDKGQELLRLDARVWENMLRQAAIELREAEKEEGRWRELIQSGAVSTSDFEAIQTRRELAEVALAQAELNVAHCVVTSPIKGVVDERTAEVGEHVNEGVPVFRVVQVDPAKIVVSIPEKDVMGVSVGRDLPFSVDALGGQSFTGIVTFVAAAADAAGNAYKTELSVPNPDGLLRPGMMADVRLERAGEGEAIVVPLGAVIPQKGEYVAYRVEDGHAVRCVVRLASVSGQQAVIESGLSAGDELVIEGHRALRDGVQIVVQSVD